MIDHQWTLASFKREYEETETWTISTYKAGVKLDERGVQVKITMENCEAHDHEAWISSNGSEIINWVGNHLPEIKAHIADKMIDLGNDWREDDAPELTKSDFQERILLESITIATAADFDVSSPLEPPSVILYFLDDDIFAGHWIELWIHEGYKLDDDPGIIG